MFSDFEVKFLINAFFFIKIKFLTYLKLWNDKTTFHNLMKILIQIIEIVEICHQLGLNHNTLIISWNFITIWIMMKLRRLMDEFLNEKQRGNFGNSFSFIRSICKKCNQIKHFS